MHDDLEKIIERNVSTWLESNPETKDQISSMRSTDKDTFIDSFYKNLSFGTGGVRSIVGIGSNRINPFNIKRISQGLSHYILKQDYLKETNSHNVLIGYDSRLTSKELALATADVFIQNNINVFMLSDVRPVALVSFGILHLKCIAGVIITASHNPKEYNGYKVYWSHGGQVLSPQDTDIMKSVDDVINSNAQIHDTPVNTNKIIYVDQEIDEAYNATILKLKTEHFLDTNIKIVYTNLHGSGITVLPSVLNNWGFHDLLFVKEQLSLDGNFPTVKVPNPELPESLKLGAKLLIDSRSDILLATDPDADRLGVVSLEKDLQPYYFSGNQIACMLAEHILSSLTESHKMPNNPKIIKTIVTTEMLSKISKCYGAEIVNVLTGFKYIGEKIDLWKDSESTFIFGAEESYGYLYGSHSRDKDAIICAAIISELAQKQKNKDETLLDFLNNLYIKYGIHKEKTLSFSFSGHSGAIKITKFMEFIRSESATSLKISSFNIDIFEDYLSGEYKTPTYTKKLDLPVSNAIRLTLNDGSKIVFRPSGTEPKLKVYFEQVFPYKGSSINAEIISADESFNLFIDDIVKLTESYNA